MEDKIAKHLDPEQYNVSVERAEAVAVFPEHTPFSLAKVNTAVKKAGFSFEGMELVARGTVTMEEKGETPTLLLSDPEAEMRLLLVPADGADTYDRLLAAARERSGEDPLQVRGRLVEGEQTRARAENRRADFALAVTSFAPASETEIPPLRPPKRDQPGGKSKQDGWF